VIFSFFLLAVAESGKLVFLFFRGDHPVYTKEGILDVLAWGLIIRVLVVDGIVRWQGDIWVWASRRE